MAKDHLAYTCEVCHGTPYWTLRRHGDAVISWACLKHLGDVAWGLERDPLDTTLTVSRAQI